MTAPKPIPVVDLFAGPGGLGEGFSALDKGKTFNILVSAEMDGSAHQTLRLRAFYRILQRRGGNALDSYYLFCNGIAETPWDEKTWSAWEEAGREARRIELGTDKGNDELNSVLDRAQLSSDQPWVLIGGPPCQAYSLVGRSRNLGKADYRAENDHRHYLYKEYLRIIERYHPAVFVMENVKGILSSKVGGEGIFKTILQDLADPQAAVGKSKRGPGYRIHSLAVETAFERGMSPDDIAANDFILRAEEYGVPQARHRVILLGIRDDIKISPLRLNKRDMRSVRDAIADLPPLRSRLSKEADTAQAWASTVKKLAESLQREASRQHEMPEVTDILKDIPHALDSSLNYGSLRVPRTNPAQIQNTELARWYYAKKLDVWLNHESRGHMTSDLCRYLYASAFSVAYGRSPKGHEEFALAGLRPNHKNWESGKFADRFRVQVADRPATTVTSHISKDGHYFIHPDPRQCRSLTVREAARLQTFPDDYFFQGNRTQQFHQVGNAVPPLLALQIANIVKKLVT